MNVDEIARLAEDFATPFRVTAGRRFRLSDHDPANTGRLKREDKPRAKEALQRGIQALSDLQDKLYKLERELAGLPAGGSAAASAEVGCVVARGDPGSES